jgi:hypothetical protein
MSTPVLGPAIDCAEASSLPTADKKRNQQLAVRATQELIENNVKYREAEG